jgi:hypothetical protein
MRAKLILAGAVTCCGLAISQAVPASASVSGDPVVQSGPSVTSPHLVSGTAGSAPVSNAEENAYADCAGGPGESCTVTYLVSKGSFATTYYYEGPRGNPGMLGPTSYNCPDTTCTYSQTGYPGGAGFSIEWDILGNNATVIEVVNHY